MKRTQYFLTYRVYKGGTANDKPRPFPGMGFFVFSSPLQLVPDTLSTTIVLLMVLSPLIGGIISELGGISPSLAESSSDLAELTLSLAELIIKSAESHDFPASTLTYRLTLRRNRHARTIKGIAGRGYSKN